MVPARPSVVGESTWTRISCCIIFVSLKKNVTITLDEATARGARIEAARRDTSVSQLVGDMLRERMHQERAYARARADWNSRGARLLKESGARYPTRAEVHER